MCFIYKKQTIWFGNEQKTNKCCYLNINKNTPLEVNCF